VIYDFIHETHDSRAQISIAAMDGAPSDREGLSHIIPIQPKAPRGRLHMDCDSEEVHLRLISEKTKAIVGVAVIDVDKWQAMKTISQIRQFLEEQQVELPEKYNFLWNIEGTFVPISHPQVRFLRECTFYRDVISL